MLRPFTLHRPSTVAEAVDLLARLGENAMLYAGGTELLLLLKAGLIRVEHLIDLKPIPGLASLSVNGEWLSIGAAATHRALERSDLLRAHCPLLANAARHVANVRVRNVGTVGGNLAFADPHSDLTTLVLALDGLVDLVSSRGARAVPMGEFVRGAYETRRERDEIVTGVRVRGDEPGTTGVYVKFGVYERPTLGVAFRLTLDEAAERVVEARLAVGCVGPRPIRVAAAEARLRGQRLATLAERIDEVAGLAGESVDPMTDLHGAADYKRHLVVVFVQRAVAAALARVRGGRAREHYPHAVLV